MIRRPAPFLAAALLAVAAMACASGGGGESSSPSPLQAALDTAVAANDGRGGGVFLTASSSGDILFSGAAGEASLGGVPMAPTHTFEVASVSKTFTATLVLLLIEEGRFSLDTPLTALLPANLTDRLLVMGGVDRTGEITARRLLNHTSGLPDYWSDPPYQSGQDNAFLIAFNADPNRLWAPEDIVAYARDLDPIGAPGERYHYSDTNYVLLALIAERATGKTLHALYRERFFVPLGMNDSYLSYRERAVSTETESHRYEGRDDLFGQTRQSADWGGGGIVSSGADLVRFAVALFGKGTLLRSDSYAAMTEWVPTGEPGISYGLGLFRVELAGGGSLIGHDGYGGAFMYFQPGPGASLVGTVNQTENDWWPLAEAYLGSTGN